MGFYTNLSEFDMDKVIDCLNRHEVEEARLLNSGSNYVDAYNNAWNILSDDDRSLCIDYLDKFTTLLNQQI
jgi:hypothetical protein